MSRRSTKPVDVTNTPLTLLVPVRADVSLGEKIACGLRMSMLEVGDASSPDHGSVDTGTGLGSDFILLTWQGRTAILRGLDLLRAWVATFDPESAAC